MTLVSGKWVRLLSEPVDVMRCIISFSPPLGWPDSCELGWAWPGLDGDDSPTPQQGQNPAVRVCLLSALSWLSFCLPLSFFSDVSVYQWLMSPLRTWLIFHLQPASQLLSELSTGPHAWTHSSTLHNISSSEALWFFGESKGWCITCLGLYMNHLTSSTPLPTEPLPLLVCFFPHRFGSDRSVQMLAVPRLHHLHLCIRINAIIQYVSHPLLPFPGAQEWKATFQLQRL